MNILREVNNDYDRVEIFVNMLIDRSTGGECDEIDFKVMRKHFMNNPHTANLLPRWIKSQRSPNQFWDFIKNRYSTYAERRTFLWSEFESLLSFFEVKESTPVISDIEGSLQILNSKSIEEQWSKLLARLSDDPEGAITTSRTLLESVCKHILDDYKVDYSTKKSDLPNLYKLVAKELNLSPDQHSEQIFKQILSGCHTVVMGLGSLRNSLGDAHGDGRLKVKASDRHARLSANIAASMSMFLMETHQNKMANKSQ